MKTGSKIAISSALVLGGVFSVLLWKRQEALKSQVLVFGDLPKKVRLITRGGNPALLDFKLPGGKRIRYPALESNYDYSREFRDDPNVAAYLVYDRVVDMRAPISEIGTYFTSPEFKINGQIVRPTLHESPFGDDIYRLPYVFGNKPANATVRPDPKSGAIQLRLPGNGRPAPILSRWTGRVNGWQVRLEPKLPISPACPLDFDVTVTGGKPGQLYSVEILDQPWRDSDATRLLCGSKPGILHLCEWKPRLKLWLHIAEVTRSPESVRVVRDQPGLPAKIKLVSPSGTLTSAEISASGESSSGSIYGSTLIIDDRFRTYGFNLVTEQRLGDMGLDIRILPKDLKDGQTLNAQHYWYKGDFELIANLTLPDPKGFDHF